MTDFVLVENLLTCIILVLLVECMVFCFVYLSASVVDHVFDVIRKVRRLNGRR